MSTADNRHAELIEAAAAPDTHPAAAADLHLLALQLVHE